MNNQRRRIIAKSIDKINKAADLLRQVKSEEEEVLMLIPSDDDFDVKRDAIETIVDNLDNVLNSIEESLDTLDTTDF